MSIEFVSGFLMNSLALCDRPASRAHPAEMINQLTNLRKEQELQMQYK
jgi:hypothetical protein